MKFLTIGNTKDMFFTFPPAIAGQILKANHTVVNQQKKAGKILEIYYVPGWNRSVVIREAKSAEEVAKDVDEMPLSSFMNIEMYPLADYDESSKIILRGIKAAEKMMPAPPK